MKRLLGFLLASFILLSVIPYTAFAEDAVVLSGKSANIENSEADTVKFGDVEFSNADSIEFTAVINVSDCSSLYSFIYLNNVQIGKLTDGENIITLNTADLTEGQNELKLVLGAGNSAYDEEDVYGSKNLDDITVTSVRFDGVSFSEPEKVNYYLPIVGAAGTTLKTVDYTDNIAVGDGWVQETQLGGNTPNTPIAVGFVFEKPQTGGLFVVDTTKLSNGKHTGVFYKNGSDVDSEEYIVDNAAPVISFSVNDGESVSRLDKVTYSIEDITDVDSKLYVDGKIVKTIDTKNLSVGSHTAYVTASDAAGNTSSKMLVFNVTDKRYSVVFGEDRVSMSVLGDASVYSGTLLKDIRMFANPYGEVGQNYLRSEVEVLVSFDNKAELVTSAVGNSIPYQSFVVNTDGAEGDEILVSYSGETGNGSGIVLKAWNYKNESWDTIASMPSGEAVTVSVDLETYSYKKKMRINAMPDIVYNGSNTIVWNSDTQYYSRFDDLNEFYYKIAQYTVDEYNAGNIGYYVHTGDLVDQTNAGDEIAHKEYKVASAAQKILDDANVPNGVVAGNHDVVHTDADYSYYWKYFGEDRYKDFAWYGGSLNDNMHHYDLVSIGAYDFVFLYLGYYKETDADTIAWANAVCQAYPDRNVVLCTHEYLLPSGAISSDRSTVIWDEIVVPNENVVMILCGHNEGVCDQLHQVGESDRYVLEILADYQFAELGVGPQHVLNNCTCDGEGYIRLMTFNEAGQLVSTTYSPVASQYGVDPYNFYPSYADSFVYDMDLIPADRSIKTTSFNVLTDPEYVGEIGEDDMSLKGCEAFYAELKNGEASVFSEIFVLDEYKVEYTPDEMPEYSAPEAEKVFVTGYENISENFRMNESNERPDGGIVKVGAELLPQNVNALNQTSGSNIFTKEINENGGIKISHEYGNGANWVTLANNINQKIDVDEFDRIYFGVTADKNTKWNICVNFAGTEINFSQNANIASLFGYVNDTPSDITGTWNGYIDLSEILDGEQTVNSIYIVTATPGQSVTFDYLFIGKSEGGKVRFVTDEFTSVAYEASIGEKIELPGNPFKPGSDFEGWYTAKEGGEKIEGPITIVENVTEVYARFGEKQVVGRQAETSNTEINLEKPAFGKIIFVCGSLIVMVSVVIVLLIKIKRTGKRQSTDK